MKRHHGKTRTTNKVSPQYNFWLNHPLPIIIVCIYSLYLSDQLEKDERSFEMQIKNRKKNLDESKKNIHGVVTSLISNAGLSDDLLLE